MTTYELPDAADAALAESARALDAGGLVVVPTETVYGVAARLDRPEGLARLRALKQRDGKPFALAVDGAARLDTHGVLWTPSSRTIASRWWPGPVTLVLPTAHGEMLGVRVPGHEWTRSLLARIDGDVALTSANLAGGAEPVDAEQIPAPVREAARVVVLDGPTALRSPSSVLIALPCGVRVARAGVVAPHDVEAIARPRALVVCSGNTCRSPMAAALLRAALVAAAEGRRDLILPAVDSAGTSTAGGSRATPEAVAALERLGLDLSSHLSSELDTERIRGADLVLCMTESHAERVAALAPDARGRIELFDPDGAAIDDPFGAPLAVYVAVAERLEQIARARAMRMLGLGDGALTSTTPPHGHA